jgi:hypothetical protein
MFYGPAAATGLEENHILTLRRDIEPASANRLKEGLILSLLPVLVTHQQLDQAVEARPAFPAAECCQPAAA